MNDSKDKKHHPIIEEALALIKTRQTVTESEEEMYASMYFDEEAVEKLQRSLSNYFHSEELITVVVALLNLAKVLDDFNAKEAALSIVVVVATAAEPLEALNLSRHGFEQLQEIREEYAQFTNPSEKRSVNISGLTSPRDSNPLQKQISETPSKIPTKKKTKIIHDSDQDNDTNQNGETES
ncbi:MAG: hypothetical protein ACFFC7_23865 [Candidatus Hermodarchaeota archaeon]